MNRSKISETKREETRGKCHGGTAIIKRGFIPTLLKSEYPEVTYPLLASKEDI
jgi:hypothetical protein